jgi:sugar phosphate isomerase/epimerase
MTHIRFAFLALAISGCARGSGAAPQGGFDGPPGLQLYSLRDQFKAEGVKAGLDRTKGFGFRLVELAGTYTLPPAEFLALLAERGLKAVSGHFPWDRWKNDPEGVAAEAKALGLEYAGCAWAGHTAPFDEKQCRETIAVFNRAGAATAKHGIRFFYHLHGFEFHKHGGGTLADLLVTGTDPSKVSFQMDVLWVVFPGQDPAALLEKYPGRWVSMHLKDLKKGVPCGDLSGKTDVRNDVAIGTGQTDWPAVLRAARKVGVKYYFIEDESPEVLSQIPASLRYLREVRY